MGPRTRLSRQYPPTGVGMGRGAGALNHPQDRSAVLNKTAGRGESPASIERSALAASVLERRHTSPRSATRRSGASNSTGDAFRPNRAGGYFRREEKRKGVENWFSSQERMEALERFQVTRVKNEDKVEASGTPFAWSNFDEGIKELPDGHWATPFVEDVVRSIQMNPQLDATMKERILDEILKELSALSMDGGEEGKYQDAAE